ncbi:uncharacterized protein LOC110454138 [Mizuhopecten yessoensis]|uniref:uncharacterized protein LOC110454138 n=1 Tax=Mizuhopecten yessoensis TaxID=6573 RepID=UPI000B4591D8|nr:uncharacterized protein LOC110454138 [Mizuhopecten yessoensis]
MDQMMETPAWVKRFDDDSDSKPRHSTSCVIPSTSRNTETSWSFASPSDQDLRSLRNSHDFPTDYCDGLSTDKEFPCTRTVQSNCTLAEEERRKKKRRRQIDDTSGYSTTSLSEMSEFETLTKREQRRGPSSHQLYVGRRRQSATDDRSDKSRVSQSTSRRASEVSKTHSSRHLSELSKSSSRPELDRTPHRIPRVHSTAESLGSLHSGRSARSNHTHRSNHSKSHTNTVQGKMARSTDHSDPFAFIQPVPESCSSRLRKTLRPCMGVLIMLILAASLGAAIYFAIELKKTHEDEIEMLRANLAVKIKKTRYGKPLDELMQSDFKGLALDYCQQMDRYYQRSHFKSTYRGCEVISIKNEHINFTLFFMEKDATTKDIISVIETAAPKVDESGQSVAVEDKFEIELENVKITIEHKRTPVSFSKLSSDSHSEDGYPVKNSKNENARSGSSFGGDRSTSKAQTTTTVTTTTTTRTTTTPAPSKTDLAWTPCAFKSGSFYPHPKACNKYFQCEHGKSRLQTCTGDLLFDITSDVCVEDRANLVCPDGAAAPPAPPTSPASVRIQDTSSTTPTTQTLHPTLHSENSRNNSSVTSSIYPSRPAYSRTPCATGKPGQLFPHPDNCLKFIQCIGPNKGVVQKCATDLVYDPETMACIFPRNLELMCPDLVPCDGIIRGYFPHPYVCSKYIQCESGSEVVQSCNVGLVWDPVINSCVFRTPSSICPNANKPV